MAGDNPQLSDASFYTDLSTPSDVLTDIRHFFRLL